MEGKRLFLIDGTALFYRSYFSFIRNPLINSKGENTSAVYGTALYLIKIIFDEKPDYLAFVFDTKEPTFRHKMYKEYKATREKMPEEMIAQYPRMVELVKAFNVPWLDKAGYEADDIIGTLAKHAERQGIETFMATADKDMMQLLSPAIKMYSMRSGTNSETIDALYLKEELGLRPDQIIDYLALMGDSSDNVPGVPKVGKKTAQNLLAEFDSLEKIYENLDQITKKAIKSSLSENRHLAELSKKLVTIKTDVPIETDIQTLQLLPVDPDKLIPLFEDLEFRTLIPRIQSYLAGDVEIPTETKRGYDGERQHYHLVNTPETVQKLASELEQQDFFVFDTETTGLETYKSEIIGMSFSWQENKAYYVPLNDPGQKISTGRIIEIFKPIFENPKIKKGGQHIKFDALMLANHGVNLQGINFDTMIAGYLISPGARQNNLDALAEKYLSYQMIHIEELIGSKGKSQKTMLDVPIDKVCIYAGEDADITFRLKQELEKELAKTETGELFRNVEMPLAEVLLQMEKNGVSLDVDLLKEMSVELDKDSLVLQKEICEMAGEEFNIKSPLQLGIILFDKLRIHTELGKRPPQRTATGQYKTSEQDLQKFRRHPVVDKILEYRKLTKLKSTYVDALPKLISPKTNCLHTTFSQTITATGRLSSSNPNLQNIPIRGERGREIRKAFIPSNPGCYIFSADYSQVELRIMAHISGDAALKEAFEKGEDIHSSAAAALFQIPPSQITPDQRRKAKEVNFGIIYGISRFGLAGRLGISSSEAESIIQSYFTRFPKVNQYIIDIIAFARENKFVTTLLNRRRYIPDIDSRNGNIRQFAERVAMNTPIQGSAADLIKLAMINIHNTLKEEQLKTKMILQVHDELVFEVPENELEVVKTLVISKMETAMELSVPLKVDTGFGKNWLEAH